MRLLIISVVLFAASVLSLAVLPAYVVKSFYFWQNLWVVHLHLNRVMFMALLAGAIVAFLCSRFDVVFLLSKGR
jgi:hypothetical protein